jgi:hypothetical protein
VYGRERIVAMGQAEEFRLDHARHMRAKAADQRVRAAGPAEGEVVALLRAQMADYAGAVRSALDAGQLDLATRITQDATMTQGLYLTRSQSYWLENLADLDCAETWMAVVKWTNSIRATFYDGDTQLGLRYALEAAAIDPTNSLVHSYGSMAAVIHGDFARGLTFATAALETANDVVEETNACMMLGNSLLLAGEVESAAEFAQAFVDWAEAIGFPSAIGMAYHLLGRTLADNEPQKALDAWTKGLRAAEGVDQWIVEVNCLREMMGVVMDEDPARAPAIALRVLGLHRRHNDIGNGAMALKYTATMLSNAGHERLAARVAGRVRNSTLGAHEEQRFAQTSARLRHALGDDFDALAEQAANEDLNRLITEVISVLESPPFRPLGEG